jgi:hypothetical protein
MMHGHERSDKLKKDTQKAEILATAQKAEAAFGPFPQFDPNWTEEECDRQFRRIEDAILAVTGKHH